MPSAALLRRREGLPARVCCLVSLVLSLCAAGLAQAATDADWSVTAKVKFLFNSHSSYEFGNPFPPRQVPLSRLEFPLDTVWAGFEARRNLGRLSLGLEYLSSVSGQETNHFKDSDWDDDSDPQRLSIFGETQCRVRPSFQLRADMDMQIADLLGLPEGFIVRPLVGYRWQHLAFTAHDGAQYEYGPSGEVLNSTSLPGNTISFEQDWCMLFAGARLGYEWYRPAGLRRLAVVAQGDVSHAWGYNIDRHLLRGDRTTREYTRGVAWHVSLGVELGLTENLSLGLEGDHLRVETTGVHKLTTFGMGFRLSNGVRAWSEQSSVIASLTYRF